MKTKMKKAISQAKESLKFLELAKDQAKTFVNIPKAKEISNEKLVAGLKKLGLAKQEDLEALQARVETLETKVEALEARAASQSHISS